jgi:hypothetical protein
VGVFEMWRRFPAVVDGREIRSLLLYNLSLIVKVNEGMDSKRDNQY